MVEFTEEEIEKIITARFEEKGVMGSCPRCTRARKWTLTKEIHLLQVQSINIKGTVLGGPSLPTFVTCCDNCGFISLHSIGALGFMKDGKLAIE